MANKANYHLLATSRSELRAPSSEQFSSPPSHFVTAPWGALGTGFPRPLASLRTACAFLFTPQSLRDSPRWGHWGPDSPDPLRRFALRAHFFSPPSHFVTAPWGALGTGFPRPLASLRSEFEDFYPNISHLLRGRGWPRLQGGDN